MINKKISIYISVYNGEKTITKAIKSILNQSMKPSKILVINDGSNDGTLEKLKFFGKKIEIINNKNKGLSYSRNLALKKLKTKYIACIDADVELKKNWIKQMYNRIKKNDVHWIGGKLIEKFIENKFNLWRSIRIGQQYGEKDITNPPFIFGCNNMLNRDVLKKNCYYRNDKKYFMTNGEDTEYSILLRSKGFNLFYLANAVCHHLADDNSKSISFRYWRYMYWGDGMKKRSLFRVIKNIIRQFKKSLKWSFEDLIKLRFNLVICNFIIFFYFIKFEADILKKKKL